MTIGTHVLGNLYGCPDGLLSKINVVRKLLRQVIEDAKLNSVGESFYQFEPIGVTGIILLSESHISMHTWPEKNMAAVDVFTCGKEGNATLAFDILCKHFKTDKIEKKGGEKMKRQEFQVLKALDMPKNLWALVAEVDGTLIDLFSTLTHLKDKDVIDYVNYRFVLKNDSNLGIDLRKVTKKYAEICKNRPSEKEEFFQGSLTMTDAMKRLEFIYNRGDLVGKNIFILGDDDLFSILLALTKLTKRIVVAEIDTRITEYIRTISAKLNLDIEVIEYNCTHPLPDKYVGQFDVFITDPVETPKGFTAFISRGASSLKENAAAYFGLTEIECSTKSWHQIQKDIVKMNFVMTDVVRKHSFYNEEFGAESHSNWQKTDVMKKSPFELNLPDRIWYHSSLVRLVAVGVPNPTIKSEIEFDESFYQSDEVMTFVQDKDKK